MSTDQTPQGSEHASEGHDHHEHVHAATSSRLDHIDQRRQSVEDDQHHIHNLARLSAGRNVRVRVEEGIEEREQRLMEEGYSIKEAHNLAYQEAFQEDYENTRNDFLHRMASRISADENDETEVRNNTLKLAEFFSQYANEEDPSGIRAYVKTVNEAWGPEGGLQELLEELSNVFGLAESQEILDMLKHEEQTTILEMQEAYFLSQVAEKEKRRRLRKILRAYEDTGNDREQCDCLEKHLHKLKDEEVIALLAFNKEAEEETVDASTKEIFEGTTFKMEIERAATRVQEEEGEEGQAKGAASRTARAAMEHMHTEIPHFESLPDEGKEAVTDLVHEGGGIVLSALFGEDFEVTDTGISGSVAGSDMELHFENRSLTIIGHKTGKPYTLPGPRPQDYDLMRLYELAIEDRHTGLEDTFLKAFAKTVARIDTGDNELLRERDAHHYHKYLGIFVGHGVNTVEQKRRLKRLGAIGDGDSPIPDRLEQLAIAIPHYVPIAGEGGIHHGQGAIGYEDFITLVDLWDEEGFVLPSLNNLKEATRQRLRDQ